MKKRTLFSIIFVLALVSGFFVMSQAQTPNDPNETWEECWDSCIESLGECWDVTDPNDPWTCLDAWFACTDRCSRIEQLQ